MVQGGHQEARGDVGIRVMPPLNDGGDSKLNFQKKSEFCEGLLADNFDSNIIRIFDRIESGSAISEFHLKSQNYYLGSNFIEVH